MKTQVLECLNDKQLETKGLSKKKRIRSSTVAAVKKPNSVGEITLSAPTQHETDQKLTTKAAYTTWANAPGILCTGGKQYIIPAATPFLKMISQNCPYGEGFAEVCFGLDVAESFYPYQLAPNLKYLSVIIPHSHLHITSKKGQTWKGGKR
ncbi:MAG: hypothetical protein WCA07_11875 [Gloeobacterales cyanobacterium]